MYTVRAGEHTFEITVANDALMVNGKSVSCDIAAIYDGYFHVMMGERGFRVEIVDIDDTGKHLTVKVNGRSYPLVLKDKLDALLEKMGMNSNSGARVNLVRAPMPGLIIALMVKDGDAVKAGDTLLVLEAMKMENIIKAPGDAVVQSVKVTMGEGVEKNQVLIEFSPV